MAKIKITCLLSLLFILLLLFCFPIKSQAYFIETPEREQIYSFLGAGTIVDIIECDNYLYAIQENDDTNGFLIKFNKETNLILSFIILHNNNCEYVHYHNIKSFNNKLYISGVLTQEDPNDSTTIYRPILIESSFDLLSKHTISSPFTSHEEIYPALSTSGYYYIAYNDNDKIHIHRLNINDELASMWEEELYSLSPRLKDIKADGDFVYISYSTQEDDTLWSKIIKFDKNKNLIQVGSTMARYQNGILVEMKIDPEYNRIIIVESKSSFINNESDNMCIKTYNSEDLMFYKLVDISIQGRMHCVTLQALEEDIYVGIGIYRLQSEYPWEPYESQVKLVAIDGIDMSIKRILDKPSRLPENGVNGLASCIYTRDEVYLESKNGIPICQKRLSLIEAFDWEHNKIAFHDFWIPKTTLTYINAEGFSLSSLSLEVYGIEPYIDWNRCRIIFMDDFGNLVNGTTTTELSPYKGYWILQGRCRLRDNDCNDNYDYSNIAVVGKEILWNMYNDSNYDQLIGFGTYIGWVNQTISGNPVLMYPGGSALHYVSIPVVGGPVLPNYGYKVEPQGEPYVFQVDQTEMDSE